MGFIWVLNTIAQSFYRHGTCLDTDIMINLIKPLFLILCFAISGSDYQTDRATESLEESALGTLSLLSNDEPCSTTNTVFVPGEKVVYKIYYNLGFVWISAGEVTFNVESKGDQYHLSALGRTYKSYDWVFKVRDYFDSFVDKESLLPERSVRNVLEGKYTLYDDVTYHRTSGVAVSKKGKTKDNLNTEEVPLEGCTHDVLSSIYLLRNMDFDNKESGTRIPMNVYLDRKIYNLDVIYSGKEQKKRIKGLGPVSTLLFRPQLVVGNIFKDNEGMKVWVSNDQNKIPLMIESPISVGSIKCVLKKHTGLKYPAAF